LNQLQLSASQRYELFLKQYPDIEQHTPNYHIASYLGITQQSLSRIRIERANKANASDSITIAIGAKILTSLVFNNISNVKATRLITFLP